MVLISKQQFFSFYARGTRNNKIHFFFPKCTCFCSEASVHKYVAMWTESRKCPLYFYLSLQEVRTGF